jgi:hypothetical protein
MKIVYYTSGITGSGRVVTGIAIGKALKRKKIACQYTILHSSRFGFLTGDIPQKEIPIEEEHALSIDAYRTSNVFTALKELDPDILLVDLMWFTLHNFISDLSCKKVFLSRQVNDRYFSIKGAQGTLSFRPADYDLVLATEPFKSAVPMRPVNPIIIRNRDEILPKEEALRKLGLDEGRPVSLLAYNGEPGEYEAIRKQYSYLEEEGYRMIYSTNYSDAGYFPIVDYFNAVDFIISGAGYNAFWEIIYFNKEAVFIPTPRTFEDQAMRIRECQEYYFDENGADQLVDIIMGL